MARAQIIRMYKAYVAEMKSKGYKSIVQREEYGKILSRWGELVADALVDGKDIKLYGKISIIGIRKYKKLYYRKFDFVDKKVKVYPNSRSDYWWWKLYWNKNKRGIKFKGWRFTPTHKFIMRVTKKFLEHRGHTLYVERMIKRVYVEPKTPDYEL
jgi:hypothetical protein